MSREMRIFTSLRFKMMLGISILIVLIMVGVTGVISDKARETVMAESLDKGRAIAQNLSMIAEEAILTSDDISLFLPFKKSVKESRGIIYAFVSDNNGRIIAHNDVTMVDSTYSAPSEFEEISSDKEKRIISYRGGKKLTYDISTPVGDVEKLGYVHIGVDGSIIEDVVRSMRKSIQMIMLAGLMLGAVGAFIVASMQVRPILMLVAAVRGIGEGKLDQKIEIKRKDEIGDLTDAFNDMAKGLQEREFIRQTFQKFVHKDVVNELLSKPDMVKVGGERKKATIIFTDIRGFTPLSESMRPEELIGLLNSYFGQLLPIIDRNGGILDKFIGDAMMIVFGTPLEKDDDSLRAVRTGLEIQEKLKELNSERERDGLSPVIMGIGINTGYVVAGNVGSEDRMEYTVLGDAVNIAARIEGHSRTGEVMISEETYRETKDRIKIVGEVDHVSLKGKSKPMNIYTVEKII
ncbi:MAG: adenylate/guanylate cyclase domain-containing protein [bacterium]|nr:adenylate/guanylate cyclase domain-containing protein [bacterium]